MRSGDLARMMSHCSFLLGLSVLVDSARKASGIAVSSQGERAIRLDEFRNSDFQSATGFEAGLAESLIRDDVIALVRVFADLGVMDEKLWHVFLDLFAELLLGQVGVVEAEIKGSADHFLLIVHRVQEAVGDVANVHIVAFEMLLENDEVAVGHGTIREMVDEQV